MCTELDNFATFLTLMSRAWGDLSDDSTEPKSVPYGRVTATSGWSYWNGNLRMHVQVRRGYHRVPLHPVPVYTSAFTPYIPLGYECTLDAVGTARTARYLVTMSIHSRYYIGTVHDRVGPWCEHMHVGVVGPCCEYL